MKRFLNYSPVRTLGATLLFLVIVLPINKLVLKPILGFLPYTEDTLRSIRFLIMIPLLVYTYNRIFSWIEQRQVSEWSLGSISRDLSLGYFGGFGAIGFTLLILFIFGEFSISGIYPAAQVSSIIQGLIILAMLSLAEELIYRGILYRVIQDYFGTFIALAVTGLLFGIGHFTNDNSTLTSTLAITIGGAMMGALYTISGRLWIPVAAHVSWNFCQVLFGVTLSGLNEFKNFALFESNFGDKSLLTGGSFGPENSIITIFSTSMILAGLIWYMLKKERIKPCSWQLRQNTA